MERVSYEIFSNIGKINFETVIILSMVNKSNYIHFNYFKKKYITVFTNIINIKYEIVNSNIYVVINTENENIYYYKYGKLHRDSINKFELPAVIFNNGSEHYYKNNVLLNKKIVYDDKIVWFDGKDKIHSAFEEAFAE